MLKNIGYKRRRKRALKNSKKVVIVNKSRYVHILKSTKNNCVDERFLFQTKYCTNLKQ